MVEIKSGTKTTYKCVPDDWTPSMEEKEERPQGDLTTGTASHISISMSKERHQQIFGKKGSKND